MAVPANYSKEGSLLIFITIVSWCCKGADGIATSIDQIPFRDSKLTQLVIPQLGRAGLRGAVLITCINPNIDDYDETISILGRQSIQ